MKIISKILLFLLPVVTIIWLLSLISNILLPFVIGMILAYFLDPAADKLESKGFTRGVSTFIILMVFIFIIAFFSYGLGPILYRQLIAFLTNIPKYVVAFNNVIEPYLNSLYAKFGYEGEVESGILLKEASEYGLKISKNLFANLWHSSLAFINLFSLLFITPIVTFYLLRDWDKMVKLLDNYLPKSYKKEVETQFKAIDKTLSAYIRGQTNVCILLGVFYAVGLTIIDLNYGFLIGFLTGVFSFIPYFGVLIGMFIGLAVALFQYDSMLSIFMVMAVFLLGQFIEGNFVTPKLVGNKVGIHPVLIIFALLAGGSLFGFIGILFAIPVIAIIGVLVRFASKRYLKSKFYLEKN